jgi:hypothetical protein
MIADLIMCIHFAIILFIVCTPFLAHTRFDFLVIHWLALTSILIHWLSNNNACILTEIEYALRHLDGQTHHREETFMNRIVSPFYNIQMTHIFVVKLTLLFYILCSLNVAKNLECGHHVFDVAVAGVVEARRVR